MFDAELDSLFTGALPESPGILQVPMGILWNPSVTLLEMLLIGLISSETLRNLYGTNAGSWRALLDPPADEAD